MLTFLAALVLAAGPAPAAPGDIVYATDSTGSNGDRSEIWVRPARGASRRLTRNSWFDGFPSWSPDRARVVFVSARSGDADVHVMNADGTGIRRLAGGSARGARDLYPAWSPDGRRIVFSSTRGGGEPEIYVMRADGGGVRRLTRTPPFVADSQPPSRPAAATSSSARIGWRTGTTSSTGCAQRTAAASGG